MTTKLNVKDDDFAKAPWTYPGQPLEKSSLVSQGLLHSLEVAKDPPRRLGQARIVDEDDNMGGPLNEFLLNENAANVDQRALVVAVGSNASAVVMHRKFHDHNVSTTIPFVTATLHSVGIGHSAHVSRRGYIAATPVVREGAMSFVVASMLDRQQLARLDSSEPNYVRRGLSGSQFRLELDGGELPSEFYIYVSKWDVLADTDDASAALTFGNQQTVYTALLTRSAALRDLLGTEDYQEAMRTAAADKTLRDQISELFEAEKLTTTNGFGIERAVRKFTYGETKSEWHREADDPTEEEHGRVMRCVASGDTIEREGQQCIVLNSVLHDELFDGASHASVRNWENHNVPPALARIVRSDDQPMGTVGIDQIVRYGIGVELQERVELIKIRTKRSTLANFVLARPQFAMMRVQTGDLAIVEQGVCLMDDLSMRIIGIEDGWDVIVEGAGTADTEMKRVRLRAFSTPDNTVDRRDELGGGALEARFPTASDTLGIAPDLPWIFLDSATRTNLGLDRQKLGTVRVRASRRYQILRELRELMFVLVLALIGIMTVLETRWRYGLIAVIAVAMAWGIRHRLRSKVKART